MIWLVLRWSDWRKKRLYLVWVHFSLLSKPNHVSEDTEEHEVKLND